MKEKSLINISCFIDKDELRLSIENLIKNRFSEGIDLNKGGLKAYINDFKQFKVNIEANQINYEASITLKLHSSKMESFEAETEIFLKLRSQFQMTQDWELRTKTSLIEHQWLKKPKISLSIFSIPGTGIGELIIGMLDDKLCSGLDQLVQAKVKLKKFWQQVQKNAKNPIPVKEVNNAHLFIDAQEFQLFIREYSEKYIQLVVQSETRLEVNVIEQEASSILKTLPLCEHQSVKQTTSIFNLSLIHI